MEAYGLERGVLAPLLGTGQLKQGCFTVLIGGSRVLKCQVQWTFARGNPNRRGRTWFFCACEDPLGHSEITGDTFQVDGSGVRNTTMTENCMVSVLSQSSQHYKYTQWPAVQRELGPGIGPQEAMAINGLPLGIWRFQHTTPVIRGLA